jgi:hypothetical protein
MIRSPTVLILGAGASVPFGFPSGRGLVIQICQGLSYLHFVGDLKRQLLDCGYDVELVHSFREELYLSMQPSVDAFLEQRSEFLEVGKAAIACALIPYEEESKLHRGERLHWYEYLFNQMSTSLEEFRSSQLSVVTFNYDRSLEHFLFLALKHSYGLSDEECAEQLKAVPIVHVYGTLGGCLHSDDGSRPYEPTVTPDVVKQCTSAIKIVHEGTTDDPELATAHDLLMAANVICFLGFGYHPANVERLKLDMLPTGKIALGSAYGIKTAERNRIIRYLPRSITMGRESADALAFLREAPVFV